VAQPDARVRSLDVPNRLSQVRRENPEWASWLDLLAAALVEIENGSRWPVEVPAPPNRGARAPRLDGVAITLDGRAARRWVRTLFKLARTRSDAGAASLERLKAHHVDGLALLEAAVRQQDARVNELAATAEADPAALRVVAQIAVLPLLHACGRALAQEISPTWWEGYCPICGAWPAFAEFRGLERKRWLRCGRCGTGWEATWLRCPFCNEAHHGNLGYLRPETDDESWKIETCQTCKSYLKAVATVRPVPGWAVLLDDLATVHLDLAALERDYRRPDRPGYEVDLRLHEQRSTGLAAWLGIKKKGKGD
jgi:FdhE protein